MVIKSQKTRLPVYVDKGLAREINDFVFESTVDVLNRINMGRLDIVPAMALTLFTQTQQYQVTIHVVKIQEVQ